MESLYLVNMQAFNLSVQAEGCFLLIRGAGKVNNKAFVLAEPGSGILRI